MMCIDVLLEDLSI